MRRYRLTIVTFVAVFAAIMSVGVVGGQFLLRYVERQYVQQQLDANRRRAQSVARMLEQYMMAGAAEDEAITRFQDATQGSMDEVSFLCLVDQSGELLSHPNPALVGNFGTGMMYQAPTGGQSKSWAEALQPHTALAGLLRGPGGGDTEIIFSVPVLGTTWFASAHANIERIRKEVRTLGRRLAVSAGALGLVMALAASAMARLVGRRYERRIEEANTQLEARVAERTRQLQGALEELRVAHEHLVRGEKMNLLGELMSGIAHELRSPLMSILSGSHILEKEVEGADVKEVTSMLSASAHRLSALIDNMLAFARNAKPTRQHVKLNDICTRAVDLIYSDLRHDRIDLVVDLAPGLPTLRLDTQQIQQVVLNLLSNARQALKESGRRGHTRIHLSTRLEDGAVILEVADNGPGIPEGDRGKVFEPFFTTKETGTGLGLSLCRRFLQAHGADIMLVPSPKGAAFRAIFPLSETGAAEAGDTLVAVPIAESARGER